MHNAGMRLWTLHPKYLDSKGLVALWRESLLAQKVLKGGTKGYNNHPQLIRFKDSKNPLGAIATYLRHVAAEAEVRGFTFDRSKIDNKRILHAMSVTDKQVAYEYMHLLKKLRTRDPDFHHKLLQTPKVQLHPLFREVPGNIESWERF
jgi:hypothetical protein